MPDPVHFILNDQEVQVHEPPGLLVLDYLRDRSRLTGTKEGCREGDCGACVVLVGSLDGDNIRYKTVTSCLMPLGEAHGKHLVTIEGLNQPDLTPPQQAIVDEGATQCGFCTPGIVVSLTGYLIDRSGPVNDEGVKEALGGHLCRCTGYRSLKAAAEHLARAVGDAAGVYGLVRAGLLPEYFAEVPARLKKISKPVHTNGRHSGAFIAGGTDLYVQRGDDLIEDRVFLLNSDPSLSGIAESETYLHVGALTSFEEFARHPAVVRVIPHIQEYMFLIASLPIRNRATLGGNIVNASPIGDMTILLLALNADLVLQNGSSFRTVAMADFYLSYKQMDLRPGEVLTRIRIPRPKPGTLIHWEKVSKRKTLDIASVNSAICLSPRIHPEDFDEASDKPRIPDKPRIDSTTISVGGVAPIPLLLLETATFLTGREVTAKTVLEATSIAQLEISPIDDIRGSAAYKRLLVRQLIMAHFTHLFADHVSVEECYEER